MFTAVSPVPKPVPDTKLILNKLGFWLILWFLLCEMEIISFLFRTVIHPCVLACSVVQSCLTLVTSMDCSPPGSSIQEIFQARILNWVTMSSSRGIFQTQESNPSLHCRRILYWLSHQGRLDLFRMILKYISDCLPFLLGMPLGHLQHVCLARTYLADKWLRLYASSAGVQVQSLTGGLRYPQG